MKDLFAGKILRSFLLLAAVSAVIYFVMRWCGLFESSWIWPMIAHFGLFSSIMRFAKGNIELPKVMQTTGDIIFLMLVGFSIFLGPGKWWHGLVGYALANLAGTAFSAVIISNKAQTIQLILTITGVIAVPILFGYSAYLLFF